MYKRRLKLLMTVTAALFAVLLGRLGYLQLVRGADYRDQATRALQAQAPLPALRGQILDRNGEILAVDRLSHQFCLEWGFLVEDPAWILRQQRRIAREEAVSMQRADRLYQERAADTWRLAVEICGVPREQLEENAARVVRRVEAIRRHVAAARGVALVDVREQHEAHAVLTGLEDATGARLKMRLRDMVGAAVERGYSRYYPYGEAACHVVGLVGEVSGEEQEALNAPNDGLDRLGRMLNDYLDGDLIGKSGVEKACEDVLRSRRGYRVLKRRGSGFDVLEEHQGESGGTVRITLDIHLQRRLAELFRRMTAEQNIATGSREGNRPSDGCIVVVSVPDGEVLAMVSVPTYDPNRYRLDYADLIANKRHLPLLNRCVARRYPPGSTAKPVAALAALGAADPRHGISLGTQFHCDGQLLVGRGVYLHCWTYWRGMPGHGDVDVVEAIKHSCNVFFYRAAARLGLERISEWFAAFGFAAPPGTHLPEEKAGTVPTREWLARYNAARRRRGQRPYQPVAIDAMQIAIGQGFLGATPMHVANAMATIARGGRYQPVVLIHDGRSAPPRDLPLEPAYVAAVAEGMRKVVNERGGTAQRYFQPTPAELRDVVVHGKTGTATAKAADLNGDGTIDAYERQRNEMAWFAGFAFGPGQHGRAPAERRGVAFAIVVEYAVGGGGRNAVPIAREALRICREMGCLP